MDVRKTRRNKDAQQKQKGKGKKGAKGFDNKTEEEKRKREEEEAKRDADRENIYLKGREFLGVGFVTKKQMFTKNVKDVFHISGRLMTRQRESSFHTIVIINAYAPYK